MAGDPIADYALLSDCRSAALVGAGGSVDWLCFPRFDSPSVFGRILGDDAGFWAIRPVVDVTGTSRRYVGPSMVLETTFTTASGTVTVTDALLLGDGNRGHELGAGSPGALLRSVACTAGEAGVDVIFDPRPEYGLVRPLLQQADGGLLARGGADVLALSSPVTFELDGGPARARLSLRAGDAAHFVLHHRHSWEDRPPLWSQEEVSRRLEDTLQRLEQLVGAPSELRRALAATWSTPAAGAAGADVLPDGRDHRRRHHFPARGGRRRRNWDYRYTWIRDASITLQALWVAACPDEAGEFFGFLASRGCPRRAGGRTCRSCSASAASTT